MRPNRGALEVVDVLPYRPLAREDVEVVEPEVDEHFLQLALGRCRANQLLGGEFDQHLPLWTAILRAWEALHAGLDTAGRALQPAVACTRCLHRRLRRASPLLGLQVHFSQGAWRQCQGRQRGEARLEPRVRHPLRMQLCLEPGVEPLGLQALDRRRRGAEREAIGDMNRGVPIEAGRPTGTRDGHRRADHHDTEPGKWTREMKRA